MMGFASRARLGQLFDAGGGRRTGTGRSSYGECACITGPWAACLGSNAALSTLDFLNQGRIGSFNFISCSGAVLAGPPAEVCSPVLVSV